MPSLFIILIMTLSGARAQTPPKLRVLVPLEASAPFDHAMTEIVKDFNATHSKFMVEVIKGGSSFQSLRAIIADHYANDLPDLALINNSDLPTLDALNIVQPLPAAWVAAKKLSPALALGNKCHGERQGAGATVDRSLSGETCSLPFQRRVPVWFYNRELLFKLNQETDRIPTSWAKLSTLSQRLYKQGELWGVAIPQAGDGAIVRWTALGMSATLSPETLADWVLKLWEAPAIWLPGSPSPEETTRLFLEQRAVIMLGTLDQAPFLRSNASFRIGSSLPDGDLSWFGTDFVILSKGAGSILAREFLDYLYRPEVSLNLFKAASSLPVVRAQSDSPLWKKEMEGWPLLKTALARKLKPLGLDRIAPQTREELATVVWEAIEQVPELAQRQSKLTELKAKLQKKLSTNPH